MAELSTGPHEVDVEHITLKGPDGAPIDAIHAPKNHLFVVTITEANQFEQNKQGYQRERPCWPPRAPPRRASVPTPIRVETTPTVVELA